ncbi:arylsulfatase [Paracoccus benzoatiresistens]|uniref:Arylsulfatase n=1 Tax=Paracoccus benzoatiresistens TaxID=2997341 RepID=A0ABT4J9P8_9RHOB|nr:arylsulfatase [Paracoccus sp. EF6]MCZ0963855.1 arylsulfatase [Paracoccus sp. EF6]
MPTFHTRLALQAVASCLLALGLALAAAGAAHAQDKRPNILLIVADDAGYADLGSFGGEIQTPNLDALAATGVRFTQFTASATCSPSRSMLLSGTDNHLAGLGNMAEFMAPNQTGNPGYEGYLNERVAPVSELLAEAGYDTFMAGKWHMGEEPDQWPAARGFQRDLTLIPGGGSHLDDMWGAEGQRQTYTYNGEQLKALRPGFHSSVDYTQGIIANIDEHRDEGRPFFAYLALQAPHDPFQLPPDWRDRYRGRYDQGYDAVRAARIERMKQLGILDPEATVFPRLPNVPAWDDLSEEQKRESARRMELYAAMVEHMDSNIGKLIGYLKTSGLYDDTLIFFMSDNGPEGNVMNMGPPWDNTRIETWGEKGTFIQYGPAWAQVSAGPFRMFKGFLTEGGIRVPLIVAGNGVAGGARTSDAFAHVKDIPATILDLAGVSYPDTSDQAPVAPLQGKSLAPILGGGSEPVHDAADWTGWELFGNRAIRKGDWKLLQLCAPFGSGDWQLYDLRADPAETRDLASQHPKIRDELAGYWDDYSRQNNVIMPIVSPLCRPQN